MSEERTKDLRRSILDALQEHSDHTEETDGAVVTGFGAVVEWMDEDGDKWLPRLDADASGDEAYTWTVNGWFFEALHRWASTGDD